MRDRVAHVKRRGAAILALCREIDEVPTERTFLLVECGLHSGFPRCCIAFYVKGYEPIASAVYLMRPHGESQSQLVARATPAQAEALRALDRYQEVADCYGSEIGYVACFDCLSKQHFVRVKRCDWHLTVRERRRILADALSVNVTPSKYRPLVEDS